MTELDEDLSTHFADLLDLAGFVTEPPPAPFYPDLPTVGIFSDLKRGDDGLTALDMVFVLLCANQCQRDKQHGCGVPVPVGALLTGEWVKLVGAVIPWMVLSWAPHLHQVPLCSVECLVQFTERRAGDGGMRRNGHH